MEAVRRLPVILAAVALLLGASGATQGAVVLCIGVGGGHVGVETAGAGHCGEEAPAENGTFLTPDDCVDVRLVPVDLERPGTGDTPSFVKVPVAMLPGPVTAAGAARSGPSGPARAPPHLAALPTFLLRI